MPATGDKRADNAGPRPRMGPMPDTGAPRPDTCDPMMDTGEPRLDAGEPMPDTVDAMLETGDGILYAGINPHTLGCTSGSGLVHYVCIVWIVVIYNIHMCVCVGE